jgi:secondary thiamine-phosphate synthase enzyme
MSRQSFSLGTASRREISDITDEVQQAIAATGCAEGLVCVSVPHCTCAVYVNENESGLIADTLELAAQFTKRGTWRHNRIDSNAEAHLAAAVIGSSVCLPVSGNEAELGTWQRIMLVELDGPRNRRVTVTVVPG